MPAPWHRNLTDEPVEVMPRPEIAALYRLTLREGGATWDPGKGPIRPSSGYGMSAQPGTFRKVRAADERAFIRSVRYLRRRHKGLIGTWLDGRTIHIDPAIVFDGPLDQALAEARGRGQLAIYAFADGTTHTTEVDNRGN